MSTNMFNHNEMVAGYLDGTEDVPTELPQQHNHSAAYVHGWLNGRDDRLGKPRTHADALRAEAEAILGEGL